MDRNSKDALRRNAVMLTNDLDINESFLAILLQERIISDTNREEIMLPHKTSQKRSSDFQHLIVKKGPRAFEVLMMALVHSGQIHIADALNAPLSQQYQLKFNTGPIHAQESTPPINPASIDKPLFQVTNDFEAAYMAFSVPSVTPHHLQNHVKQVQKETAYDIRHHPRGHFVIMNNQFFVHKSDRVGSMYDMINLEKLSSELETTSVGKNVDSGFSFSNLKGADIKREIAALSKRDYRDHDVFILCIMSHGANGVVYGVDGVKVDIETDICAPFDGSHCPTLSGKPKVFIIQACQGEDAVPGVPEADGDEPDATPSAGLTEAFQNLRMGDTSGAMPIKFNQKIPHKSDMIIAYSTVKGLFVLQFISMLNVLLLKPAALPLVL